MFKNFLLAFTCVMGINACSSTHTELQANAWQQVSAKGKLHQRHEASFVEYKGKFYSLGGRGIKPVDIFDPKSSTWQQASKPPFDIHHFQAVVYQDAIIIIGAMQGRYPKETAIKNIIYYYPEQDRWELKEEIPVDRRRGGAGVVIYQDKLYLVAGIRNGHVGGFVPWLDEFDLKTRQWKILPDAPRSRDHFQAGVVNGKIFAIGGRTTSQATKEVFSLVVNEIDQYDIHSQTWTTLSAKLAIGRAGTSTLAVNDEIWLLGGESNRPSPAHNEVDVLNVTTLKLTSFQPMVEGRHGTGAILYDNAVWTCCGAGTRGGKLELKTIEKIELK
ncbi:Kelch repeat-containing protein [Catenovulum maritimum]|nr:kelch repeat-containing protein [Catenovulum maritimum]